MSLDHWKKYPFRLEALAFDSQGVGPSFERVTAEANCHPSPNYPSARIALHIGRLASLSLTSDQSARLRVALERAEDDVVEAFPAEDARPSALAALGTEGRCESCCAPIAAGELVVAYPDATLHAGPCPETPEPVVGPGRAAIRGGVLDCECCGCDLPSPHADGLYRAGDRIACSCGAVHRISADPEGAWSGGFVCAHGRTDREECAACPVSPVKAVRRG